MISFKIGNVVNLRGQVRAANGPVDPADLTLTVKRPDGTSVVLQYPESIGRESQGNFIYPLAVTLPGKWTYRWVSDDPDAAGERSFWVEDSDVV